MSVLVSLSARAHLTVFTGAAPGPPTDVQVVEVDESLINVTWSLPAQPNGIITGMYVTSTPHVSSRSVIAIITNLTCFTKS